MTGYPPAAIRTLEVSAFNKISHEFKSLLMTGMRVTAWGYTAYKEELQTNQTHYT